jgi:metallo-beta-lactamase class B
MLSGIRQAALVVAAALLLMLMSVVANPPAWSAASSGKDCPECAQWLKAHKPFRIHGNTYFVGTEGLSSILITSEFGHVLIDGGVPESAPLIKASIEALGFRITDVKAILNSRAHFDQAGGIAELQRLSGAQVFVLRAAEPVLRTGKLTPDDPLFARKSAGIAPVPQVWVVQDEQLLGQGNVRVRVIATPGRAPGGTSWSWESCEGANCLNFVYADTLTAVGAGKYRFKDHPEVLQAFESSFRRLEEARCDVLLTSEPAASQLFQRLDPEGGSRAASIKDDTACRRYAQAAREALARHLSGER